MYGIKLFLSALIISSVFILHAQEEKNVLTLNKFSVELNGDKIVLDTTINVILVKDIMKDILIYSTNTVSYHAEFTYKFKGRRAKLVRRTYALLPDGKRVYSKKKKDMQELKVSVPGMIKGKSAESILYNKHAMGSIFVSFMYEYNYKL